MNHGERAKAQDSELRLILGSDDFTSIAARVPTGFLNVLEVYCEQYGVSISTALYQLASNGALAWLKDEDNQDDGLPGEQPS